MLDNFALSLEIHILLLFTGLFQNVVLVKNQSKTLQHVQSESIDACLLMLPLSSSVYCYRLDLRMLNISDKEAQVIGEGLKDCTNLSKLK